ncbi:MAG TPA: nucleotidyltransferase domain-containing protein [Gammaproteobacteria bacterium]|nr:nucleotidyltransferase domain-containing protein [Gammaproteobacteria bacterium]
MENLLAPDIYHKVRLKPADLDAIVRCFKETFAETDHLWIFGSRVDLKARGGDIDLYVETKENDTDLIYKQKSKFVISMWDAIGEQRIDVVVKFVNDPLQLAIYNVAIKSGVQLI